MIESEDILKFEKLNKKKRLPENQQAVPGICV